MSGKVRLSVMAPKTAEIAMGEVLQEAVIEETSAAPLAVHRPAPLAGELAAEAASAEGYAAAGRAERTRKIYAGEWRAFVSWCAERGLSPLPSTGEIVALYIAALADRGRKTSGIELALVAISQAHKARGFESPRKHAAVERVRKGIRRKLGTAQKGRAPLLLTDLRRLCASLPVDAQGDRDRALLLIGWAAMMRRSELAGLDLANVCEVPEGIEVTIRRSKTDQEGVGRTVGVPYGSSPSTCPVRALRAWLARRGTEAGPLFTSARGRRLDGRDVARIVKRRAAAAGVDARELAGHSLRRGGATAAARAGKTETTIMRQTGHRSVTMVRKYITEAERWKDNAATGIGL